MSDISDPEDRRGRGAPRGQRSDEEDGYGSYDKRRHRHSDDDDDDEDGDDIDDDDDEDDEDEDGNEDELRRDGFVVDDDEIEEGDASDSEERRRRRRKKRRRRQAEREARHDYDDALDEEDLALVAENTYQGSSHAQLSSGSKFKRLKRGRASKSIKDDDGDEDDLRAELDDLADNGSGDNRYPNDISDDDDVVRRERGRGSQNGRRTAHAEDLGLFDNDDESDIEENDYRASRRMERRQDNIPRGRSEHQEYGGGDVMDDDLDEDMADGRENSYDDDDVDASNGTGMRRARGTSARVPVGGIGGMAGILTDGLDTIDEDTWLELQDIFGDGEEYAFAMEAPQTDQDTFKEKMLADVFEPAELEAKMMTQRDEDIRTTDIPERMQMRITGTEALRPLTEDEIEEETTWVVRQLHSWLTRQESIRSRRDTYDNNSGSWGGAGGGSGADLAGHDDSQAPELFKQADFSNERFLAAVLSVLKLISQEFFEVPYIAHHRREVFVTPTSVDDPGNTFDNTYNGEEPPTREWLSVDDLWKLYDLDNQFRGFLASRRYLENMIRRLKGEGIDDDHTDDTQDAALISNDDEAYARELMATAGCVEDITDVIEWLQTQYSKTIRSWSQQQTQFKRARSFGIWEQARREGIDRFIAKIGINPQQVGKNINSPGKHFVEEQDSSTRPIDAARELVDVNFVSPDMVLKAAKSTFAQLLALDPQIRRFVRAYCDQHACVVVRPTEAGILEILDEDHPAFAFKFLRQKPISEFSNSSQFLGIEKAVANGLLRMEFSLTNEYKFDSRDLRRDKEIFEMDKERSARVVCALVDTHIKSDAVHSAAELWNQLRADALYTSVLEYLLPQMWREISQKLNQQAFDYAADACRRSLESRIDVQPARNSRMHPGEKPRVVVVAGGGFEASSRGALRVVYVDEHGKYKEGFSADSMRKQARMMEADGDGIAGLLELLGQQTVEVVAVSGMTLQTKRLFEDVKAIVSDHCSRSGDDIVVTYANDEIARLWWDCEQARSEFPNLRKEERYCVSVARTLQDAAVEYASLGKDVLKLHLHKDQRSVDENRLFPIIERAFVNVINKVGVDINETAMHAHKQSVLQYVSGLGLRKAQGIIKKIGFGDRLLESRSDLIVRRLCTRTVFVNCASFLRIRPAVIDILDNTRIHPEDYDLARKMALDALDIEDDDEEDTGNRRGRKRADGPSRYVAEVMRRSPEKLDELDLVKYAEELKRLLDVHKLETLKFIKQEMQHPNDDPRSEYQQPSDTKVLEMFTGEIVGDTIKEDGSSVVSGTVVRVQPRFAIARLDSGLEGFISIANVADYRIEEVSDELAPGQAIVAVVKRIDLEKMSLDLSMRKSDVDEACGRGKQLSPDSKSVDRYFDVTTETVLRERAKTQQRQTTARMRTIPHPLFKPLNGREAERFLANRPRGDCVIRLSSRGVDHIAITWKVGEGLFQHIDVKEEDKPNDGALGGTFIVGDSAYTDLDELIAFHIEPIVRKLDEAKRSPKFYDPETDPFYASEPVASILGPNDYSDDYKSRRQSLWETRVARHLDTLAQSTGRGAYCISLNLSKPGALVLAFKPTPSYRGITKWTARVEPNEFKLGDRGRYPDVNGLIIGFKSMQMNTGTQRHGSGRDARIPSGHDESRSRPHRPHGDSNANNNGGGNSGGSSSRWGSSKDNEWNRQPSHGAGGGWGSGGGNEWNRQPSHGVGGGWDNASSVASSSQRPGTSSGWDT
ncbi:Transcription elongation factor spt6 [Coemansia spiralis]|uniref:Transcription elongation factor SPT6 n=2 Tax=Coemansia TaxID=4863 RepID=A0A9W8KXF0_9FUNG|nr:Transcription elongation factor spt6 [Coemansia umbellata]KAJ2622398.1 Transcription elongation factor spt6 [Coemansia sp. RSA 1358]KAJ2675065.1 Transcription elongation factor spt6 [Coemansia spiralis]